MVVHRAMLRRIYDWCIDAAHKPYALWIMGAVAFAESSFFPVPPDVMLIPMSLARPQRAWLYAMICTTTSVVGGMLDSRHFGVAIGVTSGDLQRLCRVIACCALLPDVLSAGWYLGAQHVGNCDLG